MALSRRSAAATAERPKDWEDEYHRLKTKYDDLKNDYNEKDEFCKMLQVNIRKLESDLGQLNKQMGTGIVVKHNTPEDRDERNMVGVLNEQILKLKAQVKSLKEKNAHLTEELERKKRQLANAKSTAYLKDTKHSTAKERTAPVTEVEIVPTGTLKRPHTPSAAPAPAFSHTGPLGKGPLGENEGWDMARKWKARLDAAEEQLRILGEENSRLKSLTKNKPGNVDLENQLRDTNWRLQQLQVQYDYLSASTKGEPNRLNELEEYSQKVRELRRTLEELRYEKELSDAKAARTTSLEETVMELRQANRSLEDKIARLCEAPFISDAFGQHEAKLRYEEALKERDELRMKTDHMQEALATLHAALTSLKQQAAQLREEKEESDRRAEQTKIKLGEVQSGSNLLQDQLRLYSGDDGISTEDLERALTMIKRRGEASNKLHFLEDPDGESMVSMPGMKRKLEEYQMLNLRLTEENERLDGMLKMQASVNEGLRRELESLIRGRDKENKELQKKKNDSEELALKRLDKIHALEAQLRQHIYGLTKHHKKGSSAAGGGAIGALHTPLSDLVVADVGGGSDDEDNALLAELLEDKGEDLRPDENLMEIWIKSAVIKDNGLLPPGSSTFVVIDFFDYESQTTSLLSGLKPNWDFASTYRLTVDDFLLRYLAVDVVTLELNMASQGDFTLLARCTLPVSALLKSKPRLKLVNYPMLSVKTGQIVAHITLDIRLALPVSELYKLFLERHPNERAQIEELSAKRMLEAASINELSKNMATSERLSLYTGEDESRLYNELEIIIHRVNGLQVSADKRPPSAYVHFQLLGNPDKFTNPVLESCNPTFNELFSFPMITNDQQLRLLSRSKLQLSVIDVKGEELDMKNEGLIGEVTVSLSQLTDGRAIADTFVVKDPNGNKTGELHITIKWKHDLKKHREIGPLGLSGLDVELLISAFAPADFNEGIIDYQRFISFFTPSREAMLAMNKIRKFCIETCDQQGTTPRQIFDVYFPASTSAVNEHTFVETMLKTHVDVLPSDLVSLFHFICGEDETLVTVDKCMAMMSLDEVSGIPWSLCNKVRDRAQDLSSRGISLKQLFEDADQWGGKGLVTRMEFKNVLKHMGFKLVDELDPVVEAGENFRPSRALLNDDRQESKRLEDDDVLEDNDIMNDTMDNQDDVLMQTKDLKSALGGGGGGAGAGAAGGQSVNAVMKQQRKQFEDKKNDLQKRSAQVLEMEMAAQAERQERGQQQLHDPQLYPHSSHRAGAVGGKASDRSGGKIPDGDITRMSATKLQSVYRGHAARKSLADRSPERSSRQGRLAAAGAGAGGAKPPAGGSSTAVVPLDTSLLDSAAYESTSGLQKVSIIDVEDVLAQSFRESTPQLREALAVDFNKLDRQRTGFVNRKQFAHVLKQHPTIALYGPQLRTCMDFFDLSTDGTKIDFNAFLRFCHYQPPELLPSLQKLNSMIMHRDSVRKFSKYDASGSGFIKRADFFKGLAECGYGQISQSILLEMMQLFETRQEGLVNYSNFVEYVRGNQLCATFERVAEALFKLITVNNTPGDVAVREWFGKIDRLGQGKFSIQNFSDFLVSQSLDCPKEVVVALYSEFDPDNLGVQYSQFSQWLVKYAAAAHAHDDSRFSNLSLGEIQKKAFHYLIAVAASPSASLEAISDSYAIYDWKKDGANLLVKSAFVRATLRAGFPFTKHDLMLVSNEFAGHDGSHQVSYRKFLSWATPDKNSVSNLTTAQGNTLTFSKNNAVVSARSVASMIQFLDKSFQRGIDLLSVFAKYDSTGEGRISARDFCAAFADLGLSTVTETEALEVAGHYRAVAYNFVLYRHIVSEVLRKADDASGARHPDVLEVVKALLMKSPVSVKNLRDKFQQYDRKLNGNIRCEDVGIVFDELRLPLRRVDLDSLLEKFASGRSPDWLPYEQFLRALEGRLNDKPLLAKSGRKGQNELPEDLSVKTKNMIEHLILKGVDYRAVFDQYDQDISGCMSQTDFRRVLENFDRSFTAMELHALEHVYKVRGNSAKVDFIRFLHHLHPRNFGRVQFNDDGLLEKESWEIAELLRQKIRKHSHDDYTLTEELHRNFRHFARRRGEAAVNLDDFIRAVRDLGITMTPDQEREVFNMINLNGGRQFRFSEFAVFVCDPQHLDIVWKLRRAVQRANIAEKEIANALNAEDVSGLGLISAKQFRKAMKSCSIDLSDSDILRLMRRFDTEENQRLDIARFRQFLKGRDLEEEGAENKHPNRTESHTWSRLKDAVEDRLFSGLSPNEVYAIFDQDGLEKLDVVALHNGCREVGLVVSRDEVKSILRRMCQLVGGEVTRKRFFEALDIDMDEFRNRSQESRFRNNRTGGYDGSERRGGASEGGDHVRNAFRKRPELLEEVVHQINVALKTNRRGISELWESMKRLDYNRQGLLGKADFSRCLLAFGLMMKSGFERDLIDSISNDAARGQEVDYLSFQSLVEAELRPIGVDVGSGSGRGSSRERGVSEKVRADADNLIKLIRRRLEDYLGPGAGSGRKVREAFDEIDRDRNNRLDKREFARAMTVLKVELDDRDIDLLFNRFDYDRSGFIEYKEFLDLIDFDVRPNTARDSQSKLKADTDEILKLVRRKVEDHLGPGAGSARRVKEVFEEIDRDGNRKIDKREFGRAMSVLKVNLHPRDVDLLYNRFDYNHSGFIEYKEFLDLIDFDARPSSSGGSSGRGRSEMSDKLRSDTDNIIKLVRRRLEEYLGPGAGSGRKIKEAFDEIDRDRNNRLDRREFTKAMSVLRVELDDRDVDLLFDRFDRDRSGFIEYKEFLDLIDFDARPNTARDSHGKLKADTDEILKLVRRKVEDHLGPGAGSARRVKEVFEEIDRDGNRKIDKREFGRAMSVLKVNLHPRDVDLLYDRFDHNRSGFIEYKEFLELIDFDGRPGSPRGGGSSTSRSSDRLRNDTDAIIQTVRKRLEDHLGPGASSSRKIREAFDEIDRDRNNKIDKREFGKAMSILKVDLHPRDVDLLYERFDYNRSGFIEYKEFLDLIDFNKTGSTGSSGGGRSESIKADADRVIKRVRSKLEDHLGPGAGSSRRIREVFDEIDRDRNNKLDKRELAKAMSILKADLDSRDIDTLYERFDYNHSGFIEYKEFLDLIDFNVSDKVRRDSDDILRMVREKLETYLGPGASSARKIRDVFDEIDYDHNNKLDKREFAKAMSRLKVDLTDREIDTLYDRFDRNRSGTIEYKEFLELLGFDKNRGSSSSGGGPSSGRGSDRDRVREESDDIIKAIRHRLEDHLGHGSSSTRKIREAFDDIDRDRNNKIDKREFTRAMDILKVKVSPRDVDTLFDRFDTNRSGFIEYKEFLELIDYSNKPSARGGIKEEAEYVIRTVRRSLVDYLGPGASSERRIREAFDEIDADHNNKLDKREFTKAMSMLKVDISTRDIDTLYERFDRNRSGTIEYKEFLELLDFSGKAGSGGSDGRYGRDGGGSSSGRVSERVREESDDIIKTVRHRLEDHLGHGSSSTRKIREAFDDIDRDRNNKIDKREFARAMDILKVKLSARDIDTLYERFDTNRSGFIEYKEFLELIDYSNKPSARGGIKEEAEYVIRTVRRNLQDYLGPGASSERRIREAFDEIDADHNNKLDKREFTKAMSMLKVDISTRDIDTLYERFDRNRSGTIEYKEFLELLDFSGKAGSGGSDGRYGRDGGGSSSGRVSERVREESDNVLRSIRRQMERHLGTGSQNQRKLKETFDEIDRNRDRAIDKREFGQAMRILKVDVEMRDIDSIYERFDRNRNGKIDYKEFLELLDFGGDSGGSGRRDNSESKR